MNEYDRAKEGIEILLSRGMDDLVFKAIRCGNKMHEVKLSSSQVHSLENVFYRSDDEFEKQKQEVESFLKNQIRKEQKKSSEKWLKIGLEKAKASLFSLNAEELDKTRDTFERILKEKNLLSNIENAVTDLFNSKNADSKKWMEKELSMVFSKKFMQDLIASYRILQKLPKEFKNIISQMETT